MAEKKMEEKVDYTVPDFDIDNTETPLQEVPKEEATVKSPKNTQKKVEDYLQACLLMSLQTRKKHSLRK